MNHVVYLESRMLSTLADSNKVRIHIITTIIIITTIKTPSQPNDITKVKPI